MLLKAALCCCSLLAASHAAACYTVWSAQGRVVYQSVEPPVDMRWQIHQVLPQVFPGGQLVFDQSVRDCAAIGTDLPRPAVLARRPDPVQVVRVLAAPGEGRLVEVPTAALLADLGPQHGAASRN